MRVLLVPGPGIGHSFPMVPLAWALRAAGHEVLFATTGPALAVRDAGLAVADVKPGWDYRAAIAARARGGGPRPPEPLRDLRDAAGHLGRSAELLADGVLEVATRWRPDLVVGRSVGLLAAAKLRVPLVDHGVGIVRRTGLDELLRDRMAATFDRYGVTDLPRQRVMLDVAPPSMLTEPPAGWPMRYIPYNGGTVVPDSLLPGGTPSTRPQIAVTLGTAAPLTDGLDPVARLLTVATSVPAEFLLALGDVDTSTLPPPPDNVRSLGWMPLNTLLARCTALIHHGGEGTMMTALAAGVPQLVVPTGLRSPVGQAVHTRGVGLTAQPDDLTAALLTELIDNPHLREAAAEVQAEITALPTPADVVPRLATLPTSA